MIQHNNMKADSRILFVVILDVVVLTVMLTVTFYLSLC
jgi:hypothetical protein